MNRAQTKKICRGCGEEKICTHDTATTGFYIWKKNGHFKGWSSRCITCENRRRAERWNESRGIGNYTPRSGRMSVEERNRRRRARHAERMANDPDYAKRRRAKARARQRVPSGPLVELLRLVRKARFGGDTNEMAEALGRDPRWLNEIIRGKAKTITITVADDLLVKLDWDVTFTQLYPLDKPTRVR